MWRVFNIITETLPACFSGSQEVFVLSTNVYIYFLKNSRNWEDNPDSTIFISFITINLIKDKEKGKT